MQEAFRSGYILVASIVFAWIVGLFGDMTSFGTWESTTNNSTTSTEPDNLTNWDYQPGAGDNLADVFPIIIVVIGLLASLVSLRRTVRG